MSATKRELRRASVVSCLFVGLFCLFLAGCREKGHSQGEASGAWFEEVASQRGLIFNQSSDLRGKYYAPEVVSGGACLFDYDNDGDLDVYFVQFGGIETQEDERPGNQLFQNDGTGSFKDVTAAAGVGDRSLGMGCACGDYDNDGFVDLYITNLGSNILYRNNGDGTFSDRTSESGAGDEAWSSSAGFADYDADGDLDLFVVNYFAWSIASEVECVGRDGRRIYCGPNTYSAPSRDTLYRNEGQGRFRDVTAQSGIDRAFGNGLGVAMGDFNGDGRMDFYVANDQMDNQLWLGQSGGRFVDDALMAGCAVNEHGVREAGMGVQSFDVEGDGDLDLFLSHLGGETNTFYLNRGGLFSDATSAWGLAKASLPLTGFGLGFVDFDHDGLVDVYVGNGSIQLEVKPFVASDPFAEPNLLFRGVGAKGFVEVAPRGGTESALIHASRAAAFGDLDGDGAVDIVVVNKDAPAYFLRNLAGSRGGWVMFNVKERGNEHAIGAVVTVESGGQIQRRLVQTAYSYCAANDPRVHFGLGRQSLVDKVVVDWLDGTSEEFGRFKAGAVHEIKRGKGR